MMNGVADVDISAIDDWKSSLVSYNAGVNTVRNAFIKERDMYFEEFERMRAILRERLECAQEELHEAEEKLYRRRQRQVWVEDDDGDGHWESVDCSDEEARVEECRRLRDKCEFNLKSCVLLISNCRVDDCHEKFSSIVDQIKDAEHYLAGRHEKIMNYSAGRGRHNGVASGSFPISGPDMTSSQNREEDDMWFEILDENGAPLQASQVIVVDNQPLGFRQIRAVTDKYGRVRFKCRDTSDCSIYINGKEVYNGALKKSDLFGIATDRIKRLNDQKEEDGQK